MASSCIILVLMIVAIVDSSNGLSQEQFHDTKINFTKPDDYDKLLPNMDELIKQNQEIIEKTKYSIKDDYERTIGGEQNCWAVTKSYTPYVITKNDTSEYVVQTRLLEQNIRMTTCKKETAPCFGKVTSCDSSLTATCEQKFGSVSLYMYDPKKGVMEYKPIDIPIYCVCQIRFYNNK